jgi:D-alanyl-D-alanine carboxypeptidase
MLTGFAFGALLGAVTATTPAPLTHQFTATMEHRIDDLGARLEQNERSPGFAIGVIEDGRIVYARGFGYANLERREQFEPGTQTYIGSISEQFTAAAILLLQQDGKLKLDDPVTKYVPELTVAKDVTIRQLLDHTSGLPDVSTATDIDQDRTKSIKLDELIAAENKLQPLFAPGTQYRYNDFNYAIAGLIVERVGAVPLSDYLQQHIFIPLVMSQTFYAGDNGISPQHAVGYTGSPGHFHPAKTDDPAWLYGGSGVVTNVFDLAKWDIGMPLLLRVDAERAMFTPSGVPGPTSYGLGWMIDQRNGKSYIWHNGEIAGYYAMNAILPDEHIAIIVLANTDAMSSGTVIEPEAVASDILDVILPPERARVDNAIVARAKEWLQRIADKHIDRTQLTLAFSTYLSDDVVARAGFAALGKPLAMVPIASMNTSDGSTVYEFLVRFQHGQYHYRFGIARNGKIDEILLVPSPAR